MSTCRQDPGSPGRSSTTKNYRRFSELIGTAGQPTEDELEDVAADGYVAVINIAVMSSDAELQAEARTVQALGMEYYTIPVDWENPTYSDFDEFSVLMDTLKDKKILVHCAANYRVTAFVSLYGMKKLGLTTEQADEFIGSVWDPAEYPVWERFIREIRERIEG